MKISRREFLGGGAAGLVAAGCAGKDSSADGDLGPAVEDGADAAAKAVVSVVARKDLTEQVRLAVELAGGLNAIRVGETVFIKPNAVHPLAVEPGLATTTDILAVVIALVKERAPGKIIVGDRSARFFSSESAFSGLGLEQAALDAGADEVYAAPTPKDAPDDWVLMQPPAWQETWGDAGGVLVMKAILDADRFINLSVCKNHRWAVFSLSLKNLIGSIGDDSRDVMHYKGGEPDGLSRDIAIINGNLEPTLNILDARSMVVNGGPEGIFDDGVFVHPGLVMASKDRVALDAFGASLLQFELARTEVPAPDATYSILTGEKAWDLPQIVHAIDLGLGVTSADEVALAFDGVDEAAAIREYFLA